MSDQNAETPTTVWITETVPGCGTPKVEQYALLEVCPASVVVKLRGLRVRIRAAYRRLFWTDYEAMLAWCREYRLTERDRAFRHLQALDQEIFDDRIDIREYPAEAGQKLIPT